MIGIIADTHFNIFRKNNDFFIHVEKAFENFILECRKEKVVYIFILGDLFHTKNIVSTESLLRANKIITDLSNEFQVIMITGNHDIVKNNDSEVNILKNYEKIPNVKIVHDSYSTSLYKDYGFHFLSYQQTNGVQDDIKIRDKINNFKTHYKYNILLGHFAVSGFAWQGSDDDIMKDYTSGVTVDHFKNFNKVFLGHFHGYQSDNKVTYVSAPFQSRHGDESSLHGFVIFDPQTLSHRFIENINSPKFITKEFTKQNIKELMNTQNHFIRLIINQHISRELLIAIRQRLLKSNFDVDFKFNIGNTNMQLVSMESFEDINYTSIEGLIKLFIEQQQLPKEFEKEKLFNILFTDLEI